MRDNSLIEKRNRAIYDDFEHMFNHEGKRMEVIYNELSSKYFLVPKTVSKIVYAEADRRKKTQ
ncbi:hypothetical protein [Sphingobacterium siyangense]|uniref:Uncharacterized protein n=1 Tax=Sphingobacterium siyangense TaxID=459529 RepID=A0A562M8R7_9SPHI|nr:hypothetical protein [Sphingobacterium siyangense]TWI16303.1 hypothetical protein IQ31_04458 [Sphingobacterium siyangense]